MKRSLAAITLALPMIITSISVSATPARADEDVARVLAGLALLGIIAKFVATIATYPLIRAKVMLMVTTKTKTTTSSPTQQFWKCLVDEYNESGVLKGLYRGCQLQLFHTLLKSALLMMIPSDRLSLKISGKFPT